jgi:thiamine biosynthesis protein ThiI
MGVYDLSAAVGEYCDLVPKRPATKASLAEVLKDEAAMTRGRLEELVEARTVYDLRNLDESALSPTGLETDGIPEGATVLDLRSKPAWQAWHYPGALHLDFQHALDTWRSFDRERDYVLVCEVGLRSAHLAEIMRQDGFRASYFRGGLKDLIAAAEAKKLADPDLALLLAPAVRG